MNIIVLTKKMQDDNVLRAYLNKRFVSEKEQVLVRYGSRKDASVPLGCVVTQEPLPDDRLLRTDWESPNRGKPGPFHVTVERRRQ